ncbi:hypothetical protein [Halalkalibacterium ligniniphilum]|nr:hypothetical protein [Halalkalibacterium ligniniphilum]
MEHPKGSSDYELLKEALVGFSFGMMLMIVTFLFVHFVLGFHAFS